jgi:hypothetical protein
MQSDKFGRLLKGAINSIATYEYKTAPIIEDELGSAIGLSAATIQRYKAGHVPPENETVRILAEAAVQRGYLNREWLQNFLEAARYPAPEKLLERLCPGQVAEVRPARVYHNLPAPTYSQFVKRQQAYGEVVDGLRQRSAAVLIISLGGMGKTSLAREVAADCLKDNSLAPRFDAVCWVSDKDRPGSTTLSVLLDEIARTMDYPGFTQYAPEEKRREVEHLLRRHAILLVLDNFETVTDRALLAWLLRLPEPSKALITTREYRPEFRRGGWPVELGGLSEPEAQELIAQRLRVLKIERLVNDRAQLQPLVAATGGNAKALEMALGCFKYERRALPQVITDLYAARGELFNDLFAHCWTILEEEARRVLLAMPFFPADACNEALVATSAVEGNAFNLAVERLNDLTLLDVQYANLEEAPRYALHPLVRAFARAKLGEQPELEQEMRERWIRWYIELASQVGYCWDDPLKLELLDPEQEAIQAVLDWLLEHHRYPEILQLARGAGYYYYNRGLWEKKPPINLTGAEAARQLGQRIAELESLAYHIQLLSKQGNVAEAEAWLPRLHELACQSELPPDVFFMYHHTVALYALARNDLITARQAWEISLTIEDKLSPHLYVANRQWLGTCLYRQGELGTAWQLFCKALDDALQLDYKQGIVAIQIQLARIALDLGQTENADRYLNESSTRVSQREYRDHLAEIQYLMARLAILRQDFSAAHAYFREAIDLFERMGMRAELLTARQELAQLEEKTQHAV